MTNRAMGYAALLAVIGISIVFGMVVGGQLNAPPRAHAASPASNLAGTAGAAGPIQLAPAAGQPGPMVSFADIVDQALPAVVSVTATQVDDDEDDGRERRVPSQEWFRWFFPDEELPEQLPERPQPRRMPRYGEGSGFVISPDGYLLTNYHVVEDASRIEVRTHLGREFVARVVGSDPSIDLALLKIETEGEQLPVLPLGDSGGVRVGEWVIAIGNPLDFEQTVTVGVVSGKERRVPIGNTDQGVVSFLQTDAAINFGNSGGPLLDASGNVVGINTAIRRANFAEGIGFALPINHVRRVIDQLREQGYVRRGFIGITMNPNGIDDVVAEAEGLPDTDGVIVDEVQADGPAARAGMRRGDIIRTVDGDPVRDNLDLIGKIASRNPGDKVRLEVFRSGRTVRLQATLVDREEQLLARSGGAGPQSEPQGPVDEPMASTGLGLTVENLSSRLREDLGLSEEQRGVIVRDIDFDSEAADKGIRPDMLITTLNGEPVRDVSDWRAILDTLQPGKPVKLDMLIPQPGDDDRAFFVYIRVPE